MAYNRASRLSPKIEPMKPKRSADLQLSGLPRFHPANFPNANPTSSTSSTVTSPASNLSTPPAPLSPRHFHTHNRQFSDAQRHLYAHQREIVSMNRYNAAYSPVRSPPPTSGTGMRSPKPTSPRLNPLGSPGPVTPLELEERDGYLFASSASNSHPSQQLSEEAKDEIVESYIRKETRPSPMADGRQSPRAFANAKRGDFTKHRSHLSR